MPYVAKSPWSDVVDHPPVAFVGLDNLGKAGHPLHVQSLSVQPARATTTCVPSDNGVSSPIGAGVVTNGGELLRSHSWLDLPRQFRTQGSQMNTFRSRGLVLLAAAAIAFSAPAVADASPNATNSPSAQASCTSARILGQRKCIGAGQYCTHSGTANRDYHRYRLHCGKRDRRGRYHLVYR